MQPTIFRHPDRPRPRFRPLKALSHFRQLLKDKEDTEQVFHIFECLPRKGFVPEARAFVESPKGQRLMASEPYLPTILDDHATLEKLPVGTVGRAYIDFMQREGLSAAGLVAESEKMRRGKPLYGDQLEWYGNRLRDTHDLLHVLTGYGRDALGEQCVLGFTYGQNRNLGNLFISYLGGLELRRKVKVGAPVLSAIREGQRNGTAAANIVDESITALLAEPIEAARKRLNIGSPTQYHAAHGAYRSQGINPYNFLAAAA
jgi:ubiquinone biosynthesis protein COQ4